MSHTLSRLEIDHRAEHLNPTSPLYYRNRGYSYSLSDAATLAALTQQRFQIEAVHLKQTQKRERD